MPKERIEEDNSIGSSDEDIINNVDLKKFLMQTQGKKKKTAFKACSSGI